MQGSNLHGGHSSAAIPAAKVGNNHLPVSMEPRDPASVLAKHSLHSSPWALGEGSLRSLLAVVEQHRAPWDRQGAPPRQGERCWQDR